MFATACACARLWPRTMFRLPKRQEGDNGRWSPAWKLCEAAFHADLTGAKKDHAPGRGARPAWAFSAPKFLRQWPS